jgi:hypothetical protein
VAAHVAVPQAHGATTQCQLGPRARLHDVSDPKADSHGTLAIVLCPRPLGAVGFLLASRSRGRYDSGMLNTMRVRVPTTLAWCWLALTSLACGGKTAEVGDAGASSGGPSSTSGGSSGTASGSGSSSGANLPETGTAACDDAGRDLCVLCDDQNWHCGKTVLEACPSFLDASENCVGVVIGASDCFSCDSQGQGDEWECQNVNPRLAYWKLTPYACSE